MIKKTELLRIMLKWIIITIPFLHAFAINSYLPLPLVLTILSCAAVFFCKVRLKIRIEDLCILLVLLLGILGFAIRPEFIGAKNLSHSIAWITTIMFFYFWVSYLLFYSKISLNQIAKFATVAIVVSSMGVIADLILSNTVGKYLFEILPFSISEMEASESLGGLIKRPRGLAAEPGFSAIGFEMLFPIAWIYLRDKNRIIKNVVFTFCLFSYLVLTSAASIVSMAVAVTVAFGATSSINRIFKGVVIFILLVAFGLFIVSIVYPALYEVVISTFDFVIGDKADLMTTGNKGLRRKIYESLLNLIQTEPMGIGFGTLSQYYGNGNRLLNGIPIYGPGAISLYLEVLLASGFIGLISFLCFLFAKIRRLYMIQDLLIRRMFLISIISVSLHHIFLSEIWFPMLWILCALANNISAIMIEQSCIKNKKINYQWI
ncbi:O-antigen ligase family protein [Marinifilum flexuosum]|uniref:O-antigen ligase family protein n=1 Tax=Marinifilum flexuosum TaxID=1117708 RepID=UPI002494DD90|nr:O-antigen ligase family protein [Marinifilum flexuosum]